MHHRSPISTTGLARAGRRPGPPLALVAVVLLAASCTWSAPRGGLGATGWNRAERAIDVTRVGSLVEDWRAQLDGPWWTPVIAGNVAIVATTSTLAAYVATGCGQPVCTPIWQDTLTIGTFGQPTIDRDQVYVSRRGALAAYDLTPGSTCGGVATTCAPRWTGSESAQQVIAGNGVVIASGARDLFVYEAGDGSGCRGGVCPPTKVLLPPSCASAFCWPTLASMGDGLVVVGNQDYSDHIINGSVAAFDLDRCADVPTGPDRCSPVWDRDSLGLSSPPVIADGAIFTDGHGRWVDELSGEVWFAERRILRTPINPLDGNQGWSWRVGGWSSGELAFADGTLFATDASTLRAFDAEDGSIRWTASVLRAGVPSVAAGVVYVPTPDGVQAFDAAGSVGCSGTPVTCTPVATIPSGFSRGPVTLSNGRVWINGGDSTLRVLGLP